MGRDLLTALGLSEVERTRILEDLKKVYDRENKPEGLGAKELLTTRKKIGGTSQSGQESLQQVSGHTSCFLEASRGC